MKKSLRKTDLIETNWNAVIGKCLASLLLNTGDIKDLTMVGKAHLLERVGLSLKDCAALLGTTEQSITQQKYLKRKKG